MKLAWLYYEQAWPDDPPVVRFSEPLPDDYYSFRIVPIVYAELGTGY